MEIPIKNLLRQSGITLHEVADACGTTVPEVSRALNEPFIDRVRRTSLDLIYDRSKALRERIISMDSSRAMDGSDTTKPA